MMELVVFLLVSSAGVEGGSIWAKRGKNMRDLYADDVARYIGDILTMNIIEASKVDNKSKRDENAFNKAVKALKGANAIRFSSIITNEEAHILELLTHYIGIIVNTYSHLSAFL